MATATATGFDSLNLPQEGNTHTHTFTTLRTPSIVGWSDAGGCYRRKPSFLSHRCSTTLWFGKGGTCLQRALRLRTARAPGADSNSWAGEVAFLQCRGERHPRRAGCAFACERCLFQVGNLSCAERTLEFFWFFSLATALAVAI